MPIEIERSRRYEKRPDSPEPRSAISGAASEKVTAVLEDAKEFISINRLETNLGIEVYDVGSQLQMADIMENTAAARLILASNNGEKSFVSKIKRRFSSENPHEIQKAVEALMERNRVIFNTPVGNTNHLLRGVEASMISLFHTFELEPKIAGKVHGNTRINPDVINKWGLRWRPLLAELGVNRRA